MSQSLVSLSKKDKKKKIQKKKLTIKGSSIIEVISDIIIFNNHCKNAGFHRKETGFTWLI